MTSKSRYRCPDHWSDRAWLLDRMAMLQVFQSTSDRLVFDLSGCAWVDLHPLADFLLQCALARRRGVVLDFAFSPEAFGKDRRVLRFLVDAGFFQALAAVSSDGRMTLRLGQETYPISELSDREAIELPGPALDWRPLIKLRVLDAGTLESRRDVFNLCYQLRRSALAGRKAPAMRMPVPLIQQSKLLFHSILPELIDNIRIHKHSSASALFTIFVRFRRRMGPGPGRALAESGPAITRLKASTHHFWQSDIVEAVLSDDGETIQQTWLEAWRKRPENRKKRVPRVVFHEGREVRVDGPNGDLILLESVFKQNLSSLAPDRRLSEGLPELTGLHAVRNALRGSNYAIGVRSGKNYVGIIGRSEEDSQIINEGRFEPEPGVHFYLRMATLESGEPKGWIDGVPREGLEKATSWWTYDYPPRFNRAHLIETYELPESMKEGDVVICRTHQVTPKTELFDFLKKAFQRQIRLIFMEIPTPIALWLSELLTLFSRRDLPDLRCAIVTNTYHLRLHGAFERGADLAFARGTEANSSPYWHSRTSPVRNLPEAVRRTRQLDSQRFWDLVDSLDGVFVREPVQWSKDLILRGGFLSVPAALADRQVFKLLRRRSVSLVRGFRLRSLVPAADQLRFIASEISYTADVAVSTRASDSIQGRIGVLEGVRVTGSTADRVIRGSLAGTPSVIVPLFVYPRTLVDGLSQTDVTPRACDWYNFTRPERFGLDASEPTLQRLGETGMIRSTSRDSKQESTEELRSWEIWDRLDLMELGHFSYGRHHYLVWLDLLRFLAEQTGEAQTLLGDLRQAIERWAPNWIFYFQHEVADAFLGFLREGDLVKVGIYPIGDLEMFRAVFSRHLSILSGNASRPSLETALILDDAVVSGRHVRRARALLHELGFEVVHSLTLLERNDAARVLAGSMRDGDEHRSCWSLFVRPVGNREFCPICSATKIVRRVFAEREADEVGELLGALLGRWSRRDHLARFESVISSHLRVHIELQGVRLSSVANSTARALHLVGTSRESLRAFLSDSSPAQKIELEILCGIALHYWYYLEEVEKSIVLSRLLNTLWKEDSRKARELAVIVLTALAEIAGEYVLELFGEECRLRGLPNLDVAILGRLLLESTGASKGRLSAKMKRWLPPAGSNLSEEQRSKTASLVKVVGSTEDPGGETLLALEILGLPGIGRGHTHFSRVLERCATDPAGFVSGEDDVRNILAFLDLIANAASANKDRLDEEWRSAENIFGPIESMRQGFAEALRNRRAEGKYRELGSSAQRLRRYLYLDPPGDARNFREILASELIQYPPYLVRRVVRDLVSDKIEDISASDFSLSVELTESEKLLLDPSTRPDLRRDQERRLLSRDVAIGKRLVLEKIFRDLLLDVKHLRDGKRKATKGPLIEVDFSVDRREDRWVYVVKFRNFADVPSYQAARQGRTWSIVQDATRSGGGNARIQHSQGVISRELEFPSFPGHLDQDRNAKMEVRNDETESPDLRRPS